MRPSEHPPEPIKYDSELDAVTLQLFDASHLLLYLCEDFVAILFKV